MIYYVAIWVPIGLDCPNVKLGQIEANLIIIIYLFFIKLDVRCISERIFGYFILFCIQHSTFVWYLTDIIQWWCLNTVRMPDPSYRSMSNLSLVNKSFSGIIPLINCSVLFAIYSSQPVGWSTMHSCAI